MTFRLALLAALAAAFAASPASALSLHNSTQKDIKIGVDMGNKEAVESVGAGKTIDLKECTDGCGLSGPWGYSKMAKPGDKLTFDGKNVVPGT